MGGSATHAPHTCTHTNTRPHAMHMGNTDIHSRLSTRMETKFSVISEMLFTVSLSDTLRQCTPYDDSDVRDIKQKLNK